MPNLNDVMTHFVDTVAPYLTGDETKLFIFVARQAFGDGGYLATLTPSQMMDATGLDGQRALTALTALIKYDIVIEHGMTKHGTQYGIGASPNMQALLERMS